MIIWIDGTYNIGKTMVAKHIKESFLESEAELLISDEYFNEVLSQIVEEAEANHRFPCIGGTRPQTNMRFIKEFRGLIIEKSKNIDKKLIIDMALTSKECKEHLFDWLEMAGSNIMHIILMAKEETIKERITNDKTRTKEMKDMALEYLPENISFLDNNFPNAIRIKTDDCDVRDVVNEIIELIRLQESEV